MFSQISLILTLYGIFTFLEVLFPGEKHQSFVGRGRNLIFGAILFIVGTWFVSAFANIFPLDLRLLNSRGLFFSMGILVSYLFLLDFLFYWWHRAQHHFSKLWVIHMLHHSDAELNVTSSMRSHFLERPIQFLLITLPVEYFIGIDGLAIAILPFFLTFGLFFTHSNLRIRFGYFTSVLCGPQLHRIHHSLESKHQDKNFAQFFPVFDIIFGTYYKPAYNEFPKTGIKDMKSDIVIGEAVVYPFKFWLGLLGKR